MAATFDPNLARLQDHARLILGDTEVGVAVLQDETIVAVLAATTYSKGIGLLAEAMLATFAAEPTRYREHNGVEYVWEDRLKHLQELARRGRNGLLDEPGSENDPSTPSTHAKNVYVYPY